MSPKKHNLERMRAVTDVHWTPDDRESARLRFDRVRRTRRRTRVGALGALTLTVAVAVAVFNSNRTGPDTRTLRDGTRVIELAESVSYSVSQESDRLVEIELNSGRMRFDVTRRPERVFRVRAAEVQIDVLGTRFVVDHTADRVEVHVVEGRVSVIRGEDGRVLEAGERWIIDLEGAEATVEADEPAPRTASEKTWSRAAERGELEEAYDRMQREGVGNRAEELLLAADVARMTGHPSEAARHLRRVVDAHRDDPRAPLAAFTLGKVLLEELGRPSEAAVAFARARELGGSASLQEDALAREVECHFRGEDRARARELALEYVERFPNGRRITWVKRYGGLRR